MPLELRPVGYEAQQTGHLTPQGVEICYRLFDLGKSPLAVAFLMGSAYAPPITRRGAGVKPAGRAVPPRETEAPFWIWSACRI